MDFTKAIVVCEVDGCPRLRHRRIWCRAHYLRWWRYGNPEDGQQTYRLIGASLEEQFWSHVDTSRECWIWQASTNSTGYGLLSKDVYAESLAHRFAWFLATGKRSKRCILHRCDTPACVRFEHLFEGTQADNMKDMYSKGRHVSQDPIKKKAWMDSIATTKQIRKHS